MKLTRQWIAAVSVDGEVGRDPFPETVVAVLTDALGELRSRVEGEIALALVPDGAHEQLAARLIQAGERVHLVLPGEQSGPGKEDIADLRVAAASVNVPPVRGAGPEHWGDCRVWLDSVTEIAIRIGSAPGVDCPKEGVPVVRIDPGTGEIALEGFPEKGLLRDGTFEATAKYLSRGQPVPQTLEEVKKNASILANRAAPLFRRLQAGSLFLNLVPPLIVATGSALLWMPGTISTGKFTAALLAAVFAFGLKRLSTRRLWITARATAEICRSLTASTRLLDPLFPPAARYLPGHAALARSLAIGQAAESSETRPGVSIQSRDDYARTRLGGQIRYYETHARAARLRLRWIRGAFFCFTVLAVVSSAVSLLGRWEWLPWLSEAVNNRWIAGCASIAFPALAAAAIGYLGLTESSRRAAYYGDLAQLLRERRATVERLVSEASITEAVRETEGILLEEVAGWLRRQSF